ncbi:HAD family hydrolase [Streptomyces griseochromogenes]|uniref:HAD family hydrolase n=1 Tax=Streptomyces griseochromogenes TaxID=68214 RepID=A0A1B1BEF5_9ACTN|nr:HAD family hydrolase [Streptomyces griseochromogenes]
MAPARVVVWDFDGPICRLFAGHEAERAAAALVAPLERQGLSGLLTDAERETRDPRVVLRAAHRLPPGTDLRAELEELLAREELRAVSSAMPTAYADPLIRTWTAIGARMAIATDTSARAVRAYLDSRGLISCFGPHIHGRTQDAPYRLDRALDAMGTAPADALVIGGTPADLRAAQTAGVPFLGHARNQDEENLLRQAGASAIVRSFEPVLSALRATRSGRTPSGNL